MAVLLNNGVQLTVNSVDLSDWVTSVTLPIEFEALQDTAMGDVAHSRIAGLGDSTIQINFNQDFASGAPDAVIWAARKTIVAIKVRPTSAAIGST